MNTHDQDQAEATTVLAFPLNLQTRALDAGEIVITSDLADGTLAMLAGIGDVKVSITDPESYANAAGELTQLKAVMKRIDEDRKELTKPLDDEKKRVMDYVRPFTTALEAVESAFKNALIAYDQEQDRKRQLAEAEEAERLRKQQDALEKRAEKAEARGHVEKADTLREQAATAVFAAPPAPAAAPKVSGISTRKTYSVKVTNLMDLVRAVAEGRAPLKYLAADIKVLNGIAGALKEDYEVPGTKLVVGSLMSARAAR